MRLFFNQEAIIAYSSLEIIMISGFVDAGIALPRWRKDFGEQILFRRLEVQGKIKLEFKIQFKMG